MVNLFPIIAIAVIIIPMVLTNYIFSIEDCLFFVTRIQGRIYIYGAVCRGS